MTKAILRRDLNKYHELFLVCRNRVSQLDWENFFRSMGRSVCVISDDSKLASILQGVEHYFIKQQEKGITVNTLLLFDDIGGSLSTDPKPQKQVKNLQAFEWLSMNGRHCNITSVVLVQDLTIISTRAARNAKTCIVFYESDLIHRKNHTYPKIISAGLTSTWPMLSDWPDSKKYIVFNKLLDDLEPHTCIVRILDPKTNRFILYKCKAR